MLGRAGTDRFRNVLTAVGNASPDAIQRQFDRRKP